MFKTRRMLILGLLIILFNWVIISDYEDSLRTAWARKGFSEKVISKAFVLPYVTHRLRRIVVYEETTRKSEMRHPQPKMITARLGVPLKASKKIFEMFS